MANQPVTIIRGSDRYFSILVSYTCGVDEPSQPFDLTGTTEIRALFPKADGTTIVKTYTGGDITITSAIAGKIRVFINDSETALLNVGDSQSFEVEIHQGPTVNIVQFVGLLTVIDRLFP
jgi:hypothetical protein